MTDTQRIDRLERALRVVVTVLDRNIMLTPDQMRELYSLGKRDNYDGSALTPYPADMGVRLPDEEGL